MCGAVVIIEMFVFTIVFGPLPVAGEEVQVDSAGNPAQVKLTAVAKPVEATMPTVLVPPSPGLLIVTLVGPETPANPGWIVKVTGAALPLALKLESPP